MAELTPRQIVRELDRYIVGQDEAKRAVAIALRNRYRRSKVDDAMREEISPKNILMIARRVSARRKLPVGWRNSSARRSLRWRQRNSPKSAMWAATWRASFAIWWRMPSAWCAKSIRRVSLRVRA